MQQIEARRRHQHYCTVILLLVLDSLVTLGPYYNSIDAARFVTMVD